MNEPDPLLVDRDGPVLVLTLNRPDRLNAVSRALYGHLYARVRAAHEDSEIRALVLTGAGRAFCVGADLRAHGEGLPNDDDRRAYVRAAQRANRALQRCGVPVVAAVNGHAIGAGLELALSCDLVVVAAEAKLRLPELALGTFFGGGVAHTLPARVGLGQARRLLYEAPYVRGEEAVEIGLAERAVPGDAVAGTALELARSLATLAPGSVARAKALLRRAPELSRDQLLRREARALEEVMGTEDWAEGVAAFAEKREPRFRGR